MSIVKAPAQCFISINLLKGCWEGHKLQAHSILNPSRWTPTHTTIIHKSHHAHEFEQLPTETNIYTPEQKTRIRSTSFNHFSLRGTSWESCRLQVEPLGTTNFLPRPCWNLISSRQKPKFFQQRVDWLKASSKSAAPSAPWVPLCWSTCGVLSESTCWKAPWDYIDDKCRYTIHLKFKPIQVNSNSYDNFDKSLQIWTSDNFRQRQINTGRQQENLQPFLSARHCLEICLLQVEPLGTTQFFPRFCWDLRTATKIQLFQLCRLAQGFKQICGAIRSFRFCAEAPGVFCQKQSVENMLGRRRLRA